MAKQEGAKKQMAKETKKEKSVETEVTPEPLNYKSLRSRKSSKKGKKIFILLIMQHLKLREVIKNPQIIHMLYIR